jgi:uncharacterized membrane protein
MLHPKPGDSHPLPPIMPKAHASPTRLEAFSDGVIAVIITIMVLDLKVPRDPGLPGFLAVLPTLAVYLLSFAFTGVYWVNHHHLVHRTDQANERILYANLFFLFCLSLLPFFTAYVLDHKMDSFSVCSYVISMMLTGASFLLLRLSIGHHLRQTGQLQHEDADAERKHWISLFLYFVAIGLSLHHPLFALGMVALISIFWIVPTAHILPPETCATEDNPGKHPSTF